MGHGHLAVVVYGSQVPDVVVIMHDYVVISQIPIVVYKQNIPIS
jgi:hypothetical protein